MKQRFVLLFFLTKVLLTVGYIVDNEEKNLDKEFKHDFVIVEKNTDPELVIKCSYDEQEPFIESEYVLDDHDDEYEKNEETEIEDEETPYLKIIPPKVLPLRRVRRRIIPRVTGKKVMDTDRGNRNPWDRDRNPWQRSQSSGSALRRTGPMGSEKLYHLYPHLAPPGWKSKRGGVTPKTQNKRKKSKKKKVEEETEDVEVMDEGYTAPKEKGDIDSTVTRRKEKPKSRMPKKLKEEIAEYALLHGQEEAMQHFRSKLGIRIRPAAVEKFTRRLQERMERRKLREELKYN